MTLGKEGGAGGEARRHRREGNRRDGLGGGQREREGGWGERHLMNCMPVHKEKEKKKEPGGGIKILSTHTLQERSLVPLRAAPWRKTKAVLTPLPECLVLINCLRPKQSPVR